MEHVEVAFKVSADAVRALFLVLGLQSLLYDGLQQCVVMVMSLIAWWRISHVCSVDLMT